MICAGAYISRKSIISYMTNSVVEFQNHLKPSKTIQNHLTRRRNNKTFTHFNHARNCLNINVSRNNLLNHFSFKHSCLCTSRNIESESAINLRFVTLSISGSLSKRTGFALYRALKYIQNKVVYYVEVLSIWYVHRFEAIGLDRFIVRNEWVYDMDSLYVCKSIFRDLL